MAVCLLAGDLIYRGRRLERTLNGGSGVFAANASIGC